MAKKSTPLARYRQQVLSPPLWIRQADELVLASTKLEPSIRKYWLGLANDNYPGSCPAQPGFGSRRLLQGAYFMVVAYAIENYLKAVLVTDFRKDYSQEIMTAAGLPEPLKEHNLMTLARASGLTLTETDSSLLARLYYNSLWQGRFPVPVNSKQLGDVSGQEGQAVVQLRCESTDIKNLKALLRRIRALALAKIPSCLELA